MRYISLCQDEHLRKHENDFLSNETIKKQAIVKSFYVRDEFFSQKICKENFKKR